MNVIYISPNGSINPHLFPTFIKTFEEHGHTETNYAIEADIVFIELVSGVAEYNPDRLRMAYDKNIPVVFFDNREWGEMKNEKWTPVDSKLNTIAYFVRNMNKEELYPPNVFPYDWPYFPECDFEPTTKDQLFSRPYDCCLISVESPARRKVVDAILKDGRLKLHYKFLDYTQRMPYNEWIAEHKKAKLYINCEGGGMTTERPNQLFSIAALLQVTSNHLPANPFDDGISCLDIGENPTSEDIEKVVDILKDKEWLWDIYIEGVAHTKKYLSEESVANYVLDKIKNYDTGA